MAGLRSAGITKCHIHVFKDDRFGEEFWIPTGWDRRERIDLYSYYLYSVR